MNLMQLPCPHCTSLFCGTVCRFTMQDRKDAPKEVVPVPVTPAIRDQDIVDILRACGAI